MNNEIKRYANLILDYAENNCKKMLREPVGLLKHKFIVPGSVYSDSLWDWDSWLTDIALREIIGETAIGEYEKGCVLNFLDHTDNDGKMPIFITAEKLFPDFTENKETNIHKPVLAQHALFISQQTGDFSWLNNEFQKLEKYINFYFTSCRHESGLFFWIDDCAIGVDNDPCIFYRPNKSSGSIYLNCLMYKELLAMAKIAEELNNTDISNYYLLEAENLKSAVRDNCWDERDGFYYNVDLNLLPVNENEWLHSGCPRHWNTLIQRIGVWSGFMAMWAGIATAEQAERMVKEHYLNDETFNAAFGVRSLSKAEKMYAIIKSGNPSCWLGPIWGITNYMVFEGLKRYGFTSEAKALAEKTITMLGKDIEENGDMHEYYDPDSGKGINNKGFQNWNLLAVNMFNWLKNGGQQSR